MKLKTLAIAIALGSMPFAAQADLKISGDITVGYFGDAAGDNELYSNGSEINFDAAEKVGGTTFYGHTEFELSNGDVAADELRVGARGAWGELILGDADNACGQLDVGGFPDEFYAPPQGGCKGSGVNNVIYKRSVGPVSAAVSHNPNGQEHNAIGIQGKMGPMTASFGYEAGDGMVDSDGVDHDKNVTLGLSGAVGPLSVGLRANKADSYDDAAVGVNAAYTMGANKFYGGIGRDMDKVDGWELGYNRSIGNNSTFIVEVRDIDEAGRETEYGIGLKHAF